MTDTTSPVPVKIVPASASEIPIGSAMRAEMAIEMGQDWDATHPGWRERYLEYFSARQAEDQSQIFFARQGEQTIGMLTASLVDDYHKHCRGKQAGRINAVYVAPAYRRQGVGRALVEQGLTWFRERGCVAARLNSSEDGEALYRALGFKPRREMELPL